MNQAVHCRLTTRNFSVEIYKDDAMHQYQQHHDNKALKKLENDIKSENGCFNAKSQWHQQNHPDPTQWSEYRFIVQEKGVFDDDAVTIALCYTFETAVNSVLKGIKSDFGNVHHPSDDDTIEHGHFYDNMLVNFANMQFNLRRAIHHVYECAHIIRRPDDCICYECKIIDGSKKQYTIELQKQQA